MLLLLLIINEYDKKRILNSFSRLKDFRKNVKNLMYLKFKNLLET